MKLAYLGILSLGLLGLTSCPRPYNPRFCDKPDRVFVDPTCYDPHVGLTIKASPIVSFDTSIKLKWMVYILADSSAHAPFLHPYANNVPGTYSFVLPDSILKGNNKVYVEIRTSCDGDPAKTAMGLNGNVFVRRYNRISNCDQWAEQLD